MTTDEQVAMTTDEQAAIVNAVKGIPGIVDARIDAGTENILTIWLATDYDFLYVDDALINRCLRYHWCPGRAMIAKNGCLWYSLQRTLEVGEAYSYKMKKPTDGKKRKKKND